MKSRTVSSLLALALELELELALAVLGEHLATRMHCLVAIIDYWK